MERYIDLLAETRAADEEEAKRMDELNQAAEVAHERSRIAVGALDAFDDVVELGTCGHCAAARGELVNLSYQEREQACDAERNLRSFFRELRHDREGRHENLARAHELERADFYNAQAAAVGTRSIASEMRHDIEQEQAEMLPFTVNEEQYCTPVYGSDDEDPADG